MPNIVTLDCGCVHLPRPTILQVGTSGCIGMATLDLESTIENAAWIAQMNPGGSHALVADWVPPDGSGKIIAAIKQSAAYTWFVDTLGNMALGTECNPGGGRRVFFIENAAAPPPNAPVNGVVLWAENGALVCRGAAGTTTVLAPA